MWQNYQHMDTNNMIESWHKTLKRNHLRNERNVRADYLIYLLQGAVNKDFRIAYYKIKHGIEPLTLSAYDKQRQAKAMALTIEVASQLVTPNMEESKVTLPLCSLSSHF